MSASVQRPLRPWRARSLDIITVVLFLLVLGAVLYIGAR